MANADQSALRIYVGRNKLPLALGALIVGATGFGGVPLANRLVSGAEAAENVAVEVGALKAKVAVLEQQASELEQKQQRQANTMDRVDSNVTAVCAALEVIAGRPVHCKPRPPKPE